MNRPFAPTTADDINAWARREGFLFEIARRRFIQAAAIYIIAGEEDLRSKLKLFGSGALSLLYGLRRTGIDLDFWCSSEEARDWTVKKRIHQQINSALNDGLRRFVPFDNYWRPVLARTIKVQLCTDPGIFADHEPVTLNYTPPRQIDAATFAAAIAVKLLTMVCGVPVSKPRDQDVYDVACAATQGLPPSAEIATQFARMIAYRTALGASDIKSKEEQSRSSYETKYAAGEYDIPWERAWKTYLDLRDQMPFQQPESPKS
jgi:Nucleotidyl transferase AbiEii toxin, Type IV TA system